MNILIAQAFGKGSAAFGQITVATQLAFVIGAATRFGMDMAAVRRVAIEIGQAAGGRIRAIVRIAVMIALVVSAVVAVIAFVFAAPHRLVDGGADGRVSRRGDRAGVRGASRRSTWAAAAA